MTRYYYSSQTKESTYVRPSFAPLPPSGTAPPNLAPPAPAEKKKKEKPKDKVPIPGTTWTRITTTEGNVFYFEKGSKRSEWSVPEEIKAEVEELEAEEKAARAAAAAEEEEKRKEERLERLREQERIRLEVEEERKKVAEKRKAAVPPDGPKAEKKAKVVKEESGGWKSGEVGGSQADEDGNKIGPQEDEDEAEWMKAVAAEFAEADQTQAEQEQLDKETKERNEAEAAKKVFAVPDKVQVSPEEGRALFKVSDLHPERQSV